MTLLRENSCSILAQVYKFCSMLIKLHTLPWVAMLVVLFKLYLAGAYTSFTQSYGLASCFHQVSMRHVSADQETTIGDANAVSLNLKLYFALWNGVRTGLQLLDMLSIIT